MKTLSQEQLIDLAPLTQHEREVGEMLLAMVMPEFSEAEATLHAMVEEGFLETVSIRYNLVSQYAVFYHIGPGGVLYINGIQRLKKDAKVERAFSGLDLLAKSKGCKFISGIARRKGFVRELMKDGYNAYGVCVLKKLKA
jgi:hypothetical protein